MKLILENWRSYLNESRIHRRIIVNEVAELTSEQLREFPLSDEELGNIKEWGGLSGEPSLLGTGTMGSAYLFDDNKVLKITSDYAEAMAAKLIEDKDHPNVYKILKVARRWDRREAKPSEEPQRPYVIVYEMVGEPGLFNLPDETQQDVIKIAHATSDKAWRNWTDDFERVKENFLEAARNYDLEGSPVPRFKSEEKKLDDILESMQGDQKDKDTMKLAYKIGVGFYGGKLNSMETVQEALGRRRFKYVDDLASGLTFLKNNGINFTDLKTTNVLSVDDQLIIIDIGKSGVREKPELEVVGAKQ